MITQYFHLDDEDLFDNMQCDYTKEFFDEIERQFPTAPFAICFLDSLGELDEKFTDEQVIFIYDNRADSYEWSEEQIPEAERCSHRNYTKVCPSNKVFITLRDVINAMIADKHYHHDIVKDEDGEWGRYLQGFTKSEHSNIQYSPIIKFE